MRQSGPFMPSTNFYDFSLSKLKPGLSGLPWVVWIYAQAFFPFPCHCLPGSWLRGEPKEPFCPQKPFPPTFQCSETAGLFIVTRIWEGFLYCYLLHKLMSSWKTNLLQLKSPLFLWNSATYYTFFYYPDSCHPSVFCLNSCLPLFTWCSRVNDPVIA